MPTETAAVGAGETAPGFFFDAAGGAHASAASEQTTTNRANDWRTDGLVEVVWRYTRLTVSDKA